MSDISNLLIKDSYDYVIQVDPITRQVLRIGGSVPTNPIFLSGVTVNGSFKFSNGTEQAGYVLVSDSQGNANWAPVSGATAGGKYFVQDTAPNLPTLSSGDRWFNTAIGIEFVYIDDGDSAQWVEPFTATPDIPNYGTYLISGNSANLVFDYFYYGVNYDGAVNLQLPSCSGLDGRFITIKDELGNCNQLGKRIRINPFSGETIDNYSHVDMAISKMSLQLITRGNNWFII